MDFDKWNDMKSSISKILGSKKFGNLHTDNISHIVERILLQIWRRQRFPQEQIMDYLHNRKRAKHSTTKMARQLYRNRKDKVKSNLSLLTAHLSTKLDGIKDVKEFVQCKLILRVCQHYATPLKFSKQLWWLTRGQIIFASKYKVIQLLEIRFTHKSYPASLLCNIK